MEDQTHLCLIGAIAGDMIGAPYESQRSKSTEIRLFFGERSFTDDTVLTIAVADAILKDGDYGAAILEYGRRYPRAGYGGMFRAWLASDDPQPYNSLGNGSAMRVSPVGWAFDTEESVLYEAARSAAVTHNHPEGVKGAQAVALAIFLARRGTGKDDIRREIEARFGYDLRRSLDEIRPDYRWDSTCPGSVPESIIAFLESEGLEDAIRKAISLGGDADTMAAIAGSIAEAYYRHVPGHILEGVQKQLPGRLWGVVKRFSQKCAR